MDEIYIASHIYRIEHLYIDQPEKIEDSLWRIANNANLFEDGNNDNLDHNDILTEEQKKITLEFIEEFKANPSYKEALILWQESIEINQKIRWKKVLILCGILGAYSAFLIVITFLFIAYSTPKCARVNPDGSMDVFVGEVCRQKWRGN